MFAKFVALKNAFLRIDARTIYFYAFVVGCLTGGMAIVFHFALHNLSYLFFDQLAQFPLERSALGISSLSPYPKNADFLIILLVPTLGGLAVGLITKYWGEEARGTGVDHLLDSFHNNAGQMRRRTPFLKLVASTFTLSTGGSAGKEGPMALIGAGMGSLMGRWIKMGARAKRTLLLAGTAGGLGAIFRAPLGGAITAVEVLYKEDFEADALLPCIIASVTAYTIFSSVVGFGHVLQFNAQLFSSPLQLFFYIGLGLFCSGASYVFIRFFRGLRENFFERLKIPVVFKPAIGGLMIGILALIFPEVIGEGVGVIQRIILGDYPNYWLWGALFLLLIAVLKMLATSFTIQSGGSGGVLIPSLFIGAMLGGFFGIICHHFFPTIVPSVTPFIVVGMAAFFSSVTNASLGALVMVTEMTGSYELLPPLMVVGVISLITSHKWSLYKNQVTNKFSSQAHLWDMNPKNLKPVSIKQAFGNRYHRRAVIPNDTTLSRLEELTQEIHATDYIVENKQKQLVGLLSLRDLSQVDEDISESKGLLVVEDVLSRAPYYVSERDNLSQAMQFLVNTDFDKIPIVSADTPDEKKPRLLGYLRHQDILEYYYRMGLQKK